ncbi:MBL fold metallo-hydrolase RNA specificity domain-containing protein, partial [Arthrospira platensis SPKY2]
VGYQARGTIGRKLVDGNAYISLWGEEIRVAATVHTVGGFSAHADQRGLMAWYEAFEHRPPVWLVHGEDKARAGLAARLAGRGVQAALPRAGEQVDLARLPR